MPSMSVERAKQLALQNINLRFQKIMQPGSLPLMLDIRMAAFDLAKDLLHIPPFERMVFVTAFTMNYAVAAIPPTAPPPFLAVREQWQIKLMDTVNSMKMGLAVEGRIVDTPAAAAANLVEYLFAHRQLSLDVIAQQETRIKDIASLPPAYIREQLDAYGKKMMKAFLPNI